MCISCTGVWGDFCDHLDECRQDRFVDVATGALSSRKSDKKEHEAAALLLALLSITLGSDYEGFHSDLRPKLQAAAKECKAKSAAITAYAVAAFCGMRALLYPVNDLCPMHQFGHPKPTHLLYIEARSKDENILCCRKHRIRFHSDLRPKLQAAAKLTTCRPGRPR